MDKQIRPYVMPYQNLGMSDDRMWRLDEIPRNIYVAASMNNQVGALRFSLRLVDAGFRVTSRWLRNDFSDKPDDKEIRHLQAKGNPLTEEEKKVWEEWKKYEINWGENDLQDLSNSDTLVVLADFSSSSGGYHVELGYFLGSGKKNIIVVGGPRPNVFFWTISVRWCSSDKYLVDWLLDPSHATPVTRVGDVVTWTPHSKEVLPSEDDNLPI